MKNLIIAGLLILLAALTVFSVSVIETNQSQATTINKMIEVEMAFGQMIIEGGMATPEQLTQYIISVRDRDGPGVDAQVELQKLRDRLKFSEELAKGYKAQLDMTLEALENK